MSQRCRSRRPRRRPFLLEVLETRETISDTTLGPAVLASALYASERLASLASPLSLPPNHPA
jgi:hypothetical protein